ncbi:MAG: hypothetical protein HGB22_02690 [Chlorobiaceae bacterium]|nr:hypothetical protein [Chlorobiaceae bacterium]
MAKKISSQPSGVEATESAAQGFKFYLLLAIGLFAGLLVVGYINGTQERLSNEHLKDIVRKNLRVESQAGTTYFLFPARNPYWEWAVTDAHGQFSQEAFTRVAADPLLRAPGIKDGEVSKMMLGVVGTTVAISAKEAISKPSIQKIVGTIVVAGSTAAGYMVGWELGYHRPVELTDPEIRKLLQDPGFLAWLKENMQVKRNAIRVLQYRTR